MSAPGLAARSAAAALVAGVVDGRQSLSDQMAASAGPLAGLGPSERARAQALATLTLRHLGRIDAVLAGFLKRLPPPPVRGILRLAAAEMLADAVAPHAAVDAAVRLARAHPKARHLAALVNAVARGVADRGAAAWAETPDAAPPDWLDLRLVEAYGAEARDRIVAAHHEDAVPVDLTPRDPARALALAEALGAEVLPTGSLRLARRAQISRLPGFAEGEWWVQDAAAALPARLLGAVAGARLLDLCAAPGGKTLQLAAMGAQVTALDASPARLRRLAENLERTRLDAEIVVADARVWTPAVEFAAILVDAPCTASGTLRRHPDLPHLRGESDLASLRALQADLLARAWTWLAPGGKLVFCTCSLLPEEGEDQVARFLAGEATARQVRPHPGTLGIEPGWLDAGGGLRLRPDFWAGRGGMDGFYAALLEKPALTP